MIHIKIDGFPLTHKFAFRKDEWEGDNKMGGILR